jgi:hypothetical protein
MGAITGNEEDTTDEQEIRRSRDEKQKNKDHKRSGD